MFRYRPAECCMRTGTFRDVTIGAFTRPRRIALERVFNFRDLGGYTAGDRVVRWGRLYRADGIHRIEGADLARVASLGIRTVVDLRTRGELDEHGRFPVARSRRDAITTFRCSSGCGIASCSRASATRSSSSPAVTSTCSSNGVDSIVKALTMISQSERLPLVFHCSAGKDRTGVLAAILLSVLGVSDVDITDDYALSRPAMRELAAWVRADGPEAYEAMAAATARVPRRAAARDAALPRCRARRARTDWPTISCRSGSRRRRSTRCASSCSARSALLALRRAVRAPS